MSVVGQVYGGDLFHRLIRLRVELQRWLDDCLGADWPTFCEHLRYQHRHIHPEEHDGTSQPVYIIYMPLVQLALCT